MTKEQFMLEMEKISATPDWSITHAAAQVMLCMRYIESLEEVIALLRKQDVQEENQTSIKAKIAQLKAQEKGDIK
jgi:predicted transcriptional regulator